MKFKKIQSAFTLAELLIVIVIIGILASLVLASYAGITERANNASLAFDLKNASTKLKAYNAVYGSYPASLAANGCPVASGSLPADNNYCVKTTASNSVYNYTSSAQTFSLILKSPTNLYYQSTESVAQTTFTPAHLCKPSQMLTAPLLAQKHKMLETTKHIGLKSWAPVGVGCLQTLHMQVEARIPTMM